MAYRDVAGFFSTPKSPQQGVATWMEMEQGIQLGDVSFLTENLRWALHSHSVPTIGWGKVGHLTVEVKGSVL